MMGHPGHTESIHHAHFNSTVNKNVNSFFLIDKILEEYFRNSLYLQQYLEFPIHSRLSWGGKLSRIKMS